MEGRTAGQRLRHLRNEKGLSLTDVADAMSEAGHPVTRQAVSLWEHDTWPNWKNMRTLAGILGVHPSDIWPFTDDGEEDQ